ncbi:MCM2/3/5 family-domain-containing protein [Tribonema minus]|uniref:DNA replication licensing factor MCM3 n=1 Tax=Tribonema minus TaxID=303371 RepID=A0A835Z466_9STRA|nr:MCM2/3/5 family-domain-containing protein [Tribonema minus]
MDMDVGLGGDGLPGDEGPQAADADAEQDLNELKGMMVEWLREAEDGEYMDRIGKLMATPKKLRLLISLNHLRKNQSLDVARLMRRPLPYMWAFREAAKEIALREDPSFAKVLRDREIGFEGAFGHQHVSPRSLISHFLKMLVCVEGIVTKCSNVRPKLMKSVHYCPATGEHTQREYRDGTSLELGLEIGGTMQMVTQGGQPTKDPENNTLEVEYGLCQYKDHQLPRSIEVLLDNDLVDRVKPGDRVQISGVYRAIAGSQDGGSGLFRTVLLANNIKPLGRDSSLVKVTGQDVQHIRELAPREDILELLGRSLAPSIYGHEHIKRALVLQLLGGEEKNLANGTHLRGDINLLMVGDPSTAKSQLLRAVLNIAPLAINTTGRGSSGVGLTAAVTTDKETGERRLEAGAMVLADRGIVCIDEFDKMSEIDRVAIHEVMEQQTVTIAKAGIHASLNARCSVVAAANPVYGQYDKTRRPQENIGLPDSLLSRFDLLFVVLDQLDPDNDRAISAHVLRGHRYRRPGSDMEPEPLGGRDSSAQTAADATADPDAPAPVFEAFSALLHGGAAREGGERPELLSQAFLKRYLHYAKQKQPELCDASRDFISAAYATLRGKQDTKTLPVTPRCLETLIRLSTAHAKARLGDTIEEADCQKALDLMMFALYHETQMEGAEDPGLEGQAAATGRASGRRSRADESESDGERSDDDLSTAAGKTRSDRQQKRARQGDQRAGADEEDRMAILKRFMSLQKNNCVDQMALLAFMDGLNADASQQFTPEEVTLLLTKAEEAGQVMFDGETIDLI